VTIVVPLVALLLCYMLAVQGLLGVRADLAVQFGRWPFVAEITLLLMLLVVSMVASVLAAYPDAYQRPRWLTLPYAMLGILLTFLAFQFAMPEDPRMLAPPLGLPGMECTLCIASVAFLPSLVIFTLLRQGASVHPWRAGTFAVLTASALGCLTLRLSEMNDSLAHLVVWHYLPTVVFAALGGVIGKYLLKW
jgi:hypothetical protein